jgi:hypothetical protein
MPSVRKLSQEEVRTLENRGKGQRKLIEEQYDTILSEYGEGDYGEADLEEAENRLTVRNRLKAAANRRSLALDFKRTKGNLLRFKVLTGNSQAPAAGASKAAAATGRGKGRRKKAS